MERKKLKGKRIALGLTQRSVAEAVGIGRTYYVGIENGKRNGSVRLWLKILNVLNIPESQLGEYLETSKKKGA